MRLNTALLENYKDAGIFEVHANRLPLKQRWRMVRMSAGNEPEGSIRFGGVRGHERDEGGGRESEADVDIVNCCRNVFFCAWEPLRTRSRLPAAKDSCHTYRIP